MANVKNEQFHEQIDHAIGVLQLILEKPTALPVYKHGKLRDSCGPAVADVMAFGQAVQQVIRKVKSLHKLVPGVETLDF